MARWINFGECRQICPKEILVHAQNPQIPLSPFRYVRYALLSSIYCRGLSFSNILSCQVKTRHEVSKSCWTETFNASRYIKWRTFVLLVHSSRKMSGTTHSRTSSISKRFKGFVGGHVRRASEQNMPSTDESPVVISSSQPATKSSLFPEEKLGWDGYVVLIDFCTKQQMQWVLSLDMLNGRTIQRKRRRRQRYWRQRPSLLVQVRCIVISHRSGVTYLLSDFQSGPLPTTNPILIGCVSLSTCRPIFDASEKNQVSMERVPRSPRTKIHRWFQLGDCPERKTRSYPSIGFPL